MLIYVHVVTNFKHTFMIYHNFMNDSNLDPSLTTLQDPGSRWSEILFDRHKCQDTREEIYNLSGIHHKNITIDLISVYTKKFRTLFCHFIQDEIG